MRCLLVVLALCVAAAAPAGAHAQEPPDSSDVKKTLRTLFQIIQKAEDEATAGSEADEPEAPQEDASDQTEAAAPIAWADFGIDGALRCGVDRDSRAWCWSPRAGVMGTGEDPVTMRSRTPKRVAGGHTFTTVTVQSDFACALDETGQAWCWGRNGSANLGNGAMHSRRPERAPVPVDTDLRFKKLYSNDFGACGLDEEDRLHCWGGSRDKLLSFGPNSMSRTPVPYVPEFQWKQLSFTASGICGVTHDGTGYCWGRANGYVLGNGEWGPKERPTPVAGGFTWQEIQKGMSHACGLTPDGRAYCWGSGGNGWLGHDGAEPGDPAHCKRHPFVCAAKPMPVDTNVRFTELKVTLFSACGLDADGRAWCWGDGRGGTLGDGVVHRDHHRKAVKPVDTEVRFHSLRMQGRQACGLEVDTDRAWCWGHLFEKTGRPEPVPAPLAEHLEGS